MGNKKCLFITPISAQALLNIIKLAFIRENDCLETIASKMEQMPNKSSTFNESNLRLTNHKIIFAYWFIEVTPF